MTTSLPSYIELNQVLVDAHSGHQPAQVHGLLCGLLCRNSDLPPNWEELVLGKHKNNHAHEVLKQLYQTSVKELGEFSFDFQLLLPLDDQDLGARTEALGLWCQGFLTGLKLVQIPITGRDPGEVTDTLNDIIEIAQINYEDTEDNDDNESAYLELAEYVRLAILMVYQELRDNTE